MRRLGLGSYGSLLVIALLFTVSCGYRSLLSVASSPESTHPPRDDSPAGSDGNPSPTRIAVLTLRNDSPEPWLDRILADAMRREIGGRGTFDFVNDPKHADLVLRGRIRPLEVRSKSFSRFVAALEFELTLRLDLEVVLKSGDIVRLDSRMLSESDVYLASPDVEVTRTNRLEVLRRLSDVLASRVADSIETIERPIPARSVGEAG